MEIQEYIKQYLNEVKKVTDKIEVSSIEQAIRIILNVKEDKGRLFFLGVGGSAGNASHAVNDFRKIAGIESYTPTDNISELSARINDDGWDTSYSNWLIGSNLNSNDCIFVLSVGGGNLEKNISANLVNAMKLAKERGAKILGIVGRDGGYTKQVADACILIPTVNDHTVTPHSEAFQSVVLHLIVSHPLINYFGMKWESTK